MVLEKRVLEYQEVKSLCKTMAEQIWARYHPTLLVAVVRGGLTPAHIIARELKLPIGVFYPDKGLMITPFTPPREETYVFIDDVIAIGRTFETVKQHCSDNNFLFAFCPLVIDSNYHDYPNIPVFGLRSTEWIVFPWEEVEAVQVGDRGLFRDGTDQYGINL